MGRKDLTGKTINYLTVIKDNGGGKVLCRCFLCGTEKEISRESLLRGNTKSCGCLRKISSRNNARKLAASKDLTGKTFEGVKVLEKTGQKKGTQYVYKCQCLRCGNIFYTRGVNLTRGDTTSCGCEKIKISTEHVTKDVVHGTKISAITAKSPRSDNTPGVTGVAPSSKGWIAYIGFQGKRYVLYQGRDKDEAIKRRKEAEGKMFGEFLEWYKTRYPDEWAKIQMRKEKENGAIHPLNHQK